jgi:uncharacterized membrane protein
MIDNLHSMLILITALGCGLVAGVFFAFSSFVMNALARLTPAQGIAAMQSINVTVINPLFLGVFVGTAAACLLLSISTLFRWHRPGAVYLLAGCLLYIVGSFLVTLVFNVPRNDALAAVDPGSAEGAKVWAGYLSSWTAWNHVRTVAALAAAASITIALCFKLPDSSQ